MQLDEPNVTLPLASSYNTRGIDAYTAAVTNTLDQRKVNSMYAPVDNPMTGKKTLYHVKRPGFTLSSGGASWGTSGQVAHLIEAILTSETWVFSTSGNDIRASNDSATQVIVTAAGYKPVYVDSTSISGVQYVVLQIRNASFAQRVFYAAATDITTWTEISDSDFTALTLFGKMEHIDGFGLIMDSRNRIYSLDVNSLSSMGASSFTTKTISEDEPRGLGKLGDKIVAFNRETMEVFENAGNPAGSPLKRVPNSTKKVGLTVTNIVDQRNYCRELDGRLYWIDNNARVQMWDGANVAMVSNNAIGRMIQDNPSAQHYGIFRITIGPHDGIAISLTTTAAATQRWLMYFPKWNDWFEWNSVVACPTTCDRRPHVLLGVGSNQQHTYISSFTDSWTDDGTNYDRVIQFALPDGGNDRKFMRWAGLRQDIERSACNESVQFSDDDGQTWSTAVNIDCTSAKPHIYRCGSYRKRLVRLTNSSNHERRIEQFLARVD